MPRGIQMEGQDTKKGDIKGGESPKKRERRYLFMKQEKEKVNNALFGVELKHYM